MIDRDRQRETDEAHLRWFWNSAEGDLGLSGSGDFERAAQASFAPTPRCPECSFVGGRADHAHRQRRAKCRACLGLGVVVPTTYPAGNAPASPSEESPWMRLMRRDASPPILSAREPAWMGLVGPAAAARRRHRFVRLALVAMDAGHVRVLHAVLGPAPRALPEDAPEAAVILAAMNRGLPERARELLLRRLRAGNRDRFAHGAGRRHVEMLLAGSWRAWDRARGRVVDEDRAPIVEALAASDRLLDASVALLRLVSEERASGVHAVVTADDSQPERLAE